jgi:predicted nucleic acid-binding protein
MTYYVIDASVWVSRLVSEDVFHAVVKEWMSAQRQEGAQFISPALLLAEIGGAISRRTNEPTLALNAIKQVKHLPGLRLVEMDNALMQTAAQLAAELGLRGADAIYVAVAARLHLPLVTLDIDQKQRAAARVVIQEFPT